MPEPWRTEGGAKVLVVAADRGAGELLARLLEQAGHRVDAAFAASVGLEELSEADPPFDLVVVDLGGSGADGVALLDDIRHRGRAADARVVVCADSTEHRGSAWTHGADGFLVHPFRADDLVAEAAAALGRADEDRDAHRQRQIGLSLPDPPA